MAFSSLLISATARRQAFENWKQGVRERAQFAYDLASEVHLQLGRQRLFRLLARRHAASVAKLLRWRRSCRGATILCVGNGPSLRDVDPDHLDRFPVLLTNHASSVVPRRPKRMMGTVITDDYRLIEAVPLLPRWARPLLVSGHLSIDGHAWSAARIARKAEFALKPVITWLPGNYDLPGLRQIIMGNYDAGFSVDLADGLRLNKSVIFSTIQIARFVGARRIVLLGVEMDYSGPQKHCASDVRDLVPQFTYETHARDSFVVAKDVCDAHGVDLINATPGGLVDVLPRVPLAEL